MPTTQSLSIAEARRVALVAQQFARSAGAPTSVKAFAGVVGELGALQMDSVNVLVRSHYLPVLSRYGAYAPELLDRAAYAGRSRLLFEYWGHEASLMRVELWPLLRWRMERARRGEGVWGSLRRYALGRSALVQSALAQIREQGPLAASELEDCGRSKGNWWGWSNGKKVLEWLFWTGEVSTARRRNFERLYDLTERVLPPSALGVPVPEPQAAQRELMAIAARALGVATVRDMRDYFRLPAAEVARLAQELAEEGRLEPVSVEGWKQPAYLCRPLRLPRRVEAAALLSPFDSLIWERQRTERLFDFHFRLEIYTPAHKRRHGYYVLPFLLGERLVGRVDLKSDRPGSCLQVRGGSLEPGITVDEAREPLATQLQALAQWLGLEKVAVISRRGELLRALRASFVTGRPRARKARAAAAIAPVSAPSSAPTSRRSR